MQYRSPFDNWYTYSTVHKPLPDFTCETGLVLFPPELVPGVGHPLVDKLGNHAVRRLTMRKLESYNAFTEKLEYKAVMAASIKIAQNPRAFGLSEQAGREARLIVTDESHHAYVAIELIKQIPRFSESRGSPRMDGPCNGVFASQRKDPLGRGRGIRNGIC